MLGSEGAGSLERRDNWWQEGVTGPAVQLESGTGRARQQCFACVGVLGG